MKTQEQSDLGVYCLYRITFVQKFRILTIYSVEWLLKTHELRFSNPCRPPDKSAQLKINILISQASICCGYSRELSQ